MGIIRKLLAWFEHPTLDVDQDPSDWVLGLCLILLIAFAWTRVVKQVMEVA